jgi:acetylornithine deacetylase/succinyl-diaminopimelate desuccinylase-like protein
MGGTKAGAIKRALAGFDDDGFDDGGFEARLAALVAIPSTSQDPAHAADLAAYLENAIRPWLQRMGFTVEVHPNPVPGSGPILLAVRREDAGPVVLTYGHGDTVLGMAGQWAEGRDPWTLRREGDRWYGRGAADNKGQHAINLMALEAVLAERAGRLGFTLKLVLEMSEEQGSPGLRAFVEAHRDALAADVLLASDGPRVQAATPTLSTGTRGSYHFDLVVDLRPGGVHSGNWGGMTRDPAIILAHALAAIADRQGRILVPGWLPAAIPAPVRGALSGLALVAEGGAATIDPDWGEPGLTAAEKVYAWTSFIVLAMLAGRPDSPVNAVAPRAHAHCQLRYTVDVDPEAFAPALRAHLDAAGFPEVQVVPHGVRMAASRTSPDDPWVRWAAASMAASLGRPVQLIPNSGGGLPGDVFMDLLGTPLAWVPHSYNGCRQHGPDEHLLAAPAREGMVAFAGLWWDLGEDGVPEGRTRTGMVGATGIEPVTLRV